MLKRLISLAAILFSISAAARGYCADASVIRLKYSNYFPATHRYAVLGAQFCEEIKRRTNGKVEITYYPGGILTTAPKMYDGVENGVSDIGLAHIEYTRGRFPVSESLSLPLGYTSGYVASMTANDFYEKVKPKEWNKVHVLHFFATGPGVLSTVKAPIKTLEDLKGKKLRAAGRPADALKDLGGTPVPVEMADIYEGLQRGVVDGVMSSMEVLKGWKTGELIRYVTLCQRVGTVYPFYVVMNKEKWDGLPVEVKKVFGDVSAEWKEKYSRASNEVDIEGREYLKKFGGQLIELSREEGARWEAAVGPTIERHKKELAAKGIPEGESDGYVRFIRERVDYWSKKEKEQKIPSPY